MHLQNYNRNSSSVLSLYLPQQKRKISVGRCKHGPLEWSPKGVTCACRACVVRVSYNSRLCARVARACSLGALQTRTLGVVAKGSHVRVSHVRGTRVVQLPLHIVGFVRVSHGLAALERCSNNAPRDDYGVVRELSHLEMGSIPSCVAQRLEINRRAIHARPPVARPAPWRYWSSAPRLCQPPA